MSEANSLADTANPSKAPPVVVDFTLSRSSFIRATHAAWRSLAIVKVLAVMMFVLLGATVVVLVMGVDPADQAPVVVFVFLALVFYWAYPAIAYHRNPDFRRSIGFKFSKNEFRCRRGDTEATLAWSALKSVVEAGDFYILSLPERRRIAVPKSAFDPGEEQHFRLLAATSGVQIQ